MAKRLHTLFIIAVVLLVPSLVFAGSQKFGVAKAVHGGENTVVVPLEITNDIELAALDIPLRFSHGVTLKEVDFSDTRVSYFDMKIARIRNDERTVVLGLLPQFASTNKPALAPGNGVIARLVFEINDPTVDAITVEAVKMEKPYHTLTFLYHENTPSGVKKICSFHPEFPGTTVSLVGVAGNAFPATFALKQNYPNPFNPSTTVAFDLPKASHVEITIYNVLGQKVKTLAKGEMDAGSHSVVWDASDNSSGVYFYRIDAGEFTQTKKMMMLK